MAFCKKKDNPETQPTVLRCKGASDEQEFDIVQRLSAILSCFLNEKETYEESLDHQRQQIKSLFDGMLERKIMQIRELGLSVTELQKSLRESQQQSQELRRAVYERDQEIIRLRRKVENNEIRGMVAQSSTATQRLKVADMCNTLMSFNDGGSEQGMITTRQPLVRLFEDDKTSEEEPKRKAMTPICNSNSISLGQTLNLERRVSIGKMLRKYESSRIAKGRGKENDKAFLEQYGKKCRKKGAVNMTGQAPSRGSLPSRSKKTLTQLEVPPYRECVRTSLKMLKKLSVVL